MFAALLVIALSQAPDPANLNGPIFSSPARSSHAFKLRLDYEWPSASTDRVPLCTDDPDCVAVCAIGVLSGSASAWECKGHDGNTFGTVTDPGGGTTIDSFIANTKAREMTYAVAPDVRSASLDAIFGGSSPHTVIMGGYGRASGAPNGYNEWWSGLGTAGDFEFSVSGGNGLQYESGVSNSTSSDTGNEAYSLIALRRDGDRTFKANVDSAVYTKVSDGGVTGVTGTPHYAMGKLYGFPGFELHGPLIFVAYYSTYKSDAYVRAVLDKYWRAYTAPGALSGLSTGVRFIDNTAATGNADPLYAGSALVDSRGLVTESTFTNIWATNTADPTSWDLVGAPLIDAGTVINPFSRALGNANACKLVVTRDGGVSDGFVAHASAGAATSWYNMSGYVAAGTVGPVTDKVHFQWITDGAIADAGCNFSGLTSTLQRVSCSALITSPSSVKAQALVGNNVGDLGSVQMCQMQLTPGPELRLPVQNNTLRGNVHYTMDPVADAWPDPSTGGCYEVVHTPLFDPLSQYVTNLGTYYLFDVSKTNNHTIAFVFGYTVPGRLLMVFRDGPGGHVSDLTIDGVGLTPGQPYATRGCWRPAGGGKCRLYAYHNSCGATPTAACHASSFIASDASGTAVCPVAADQVMLGDRNDLTVPSSVVLNAVRVYSL